MEQFVEPLDARWNVPPTQRFVGDDDCGWTWIPQEVCRTRNKVSPGDSERPSSSGSACGVPAQDDQIQQ